MSSNDAPLPPIDFTEDVEKYEARAERADVSFPKCKHENIKVVGAELRCPCGVGYTGERIYELYKLLTNKK